MVLKHVSTHAFFYVIFNLSYNVIEAIYYFTIGFIFQKRGLIFGFYLATYYIQFFSFALMLGGINILTMTKSYVDFVELSSDSE